MVDILSINAGEKRMTCTHGEKLSFLFLVIILGNLILNLEGRKVHILASLVCNLFYF